MNEKRQGMNDECFWPLSSLVITSLKDMDMSTYPLMDHADELHAVSGRPLNEITLEGLEELSIADVQISPATLRAQAAIARQAGFQQLATNLTRAAELTAVPNDQLLRMYELLRPQRASQAELLEL